MTAGDLALGADAAAAGNWSRARDAYRNALDVSASAEAHEGLAMAQWWLGEMPAGLAHGAQAYAGYRHGHDLAGAVRCAIWLAIVHKSNFADAVAANGWIRRAERLLADEPVGALTGWVLVARGYQHSDLGAAARWTADALDLARRTGDLDLELVALAQQGRIEVGTGRRQNGFALLDEAMAATLAGEGVRLDTVAYVCCDLLVACEQAADPDRAEQWCRLADDFVAQHGCPFLEAECRISYGSVLLGQGRWTAAEHHLAAGLAMTDFAPALRVRARSRLAGLLVRQGREEDAAEVLSDSDPDGALDLARAALALSRGEPDRVLRLLEHLTPANAVERADALGLSIEASLAAAQPARAAAQLAVLTELIGRSDVPRLRAGLALAEGRVALAAGHFEQAVTAMRRAESLYVAARLPYELACCRVDLARTLHPLEPETAVRAAEAALAGFTDLGAGPGRDRTAALLRGWGCGPRAGPRDHGVLTRREQEVLGLLGLGLSNPEIGARLHLSRKTVAHHVSRVLTKLQLRNRAAAAGFAARLAQTSARDWVS